MKLLNRLLCLTQMGIGAVALALIFFPSAVFPASPTLRVSIQQSTNRTALVTWGPPQANLQCTAGLTGSFTNLQVTPPYKVDTRLAPAAGYRACLSVSQPMVFVWHDTILQPGKVVIEWTPRNSSLQQLQNAQWQNVSSTPVTDWYYPPTPLESPAVPGGVVAGTRVFRVASSAAAAGSSVFSVNVMGYANLVFQTGQSNYFSFPLQHFDAKLNSLLPLPPEADGSVIYFYDPSTHSFGAPLIFEAEIGWVDANGDSALRPPGASACVIVPQSSTPGATTVVSTTVGEISSGTYQRTLPPGYSLNGPLVPLRGGISSVQNLQPNEGDRVLLFNPTTREFDAYEFFADEWIFVDDFSIREPVIGPGDAFFYVDSEGPLIWTRDFVIN